MSQFDSVTCKVYRICRDLLHLDFGSAVIVVNRPAELRTMGAILTRHTPNGLSFEGKIAC